jgi:hypothetical protein
MAQVDGPNADGPKVGSKLECPTCGTVVVVVKAPDRPLVCCGAPLGDTPKTEQEPARG